MINATMAATGGRAPFGKILLLAGLLCLGSSLLAEGSQGPAAAGGQPGPEGGGPIAGRTLVLIELAGGNDGLDTVIPYADPAYAQARPTLAVPADKVLPLGRGLGLNPTMSPLLDSWKAGDMAVLLGVGYNPPNRSHFRSIAIWESASAPEELVTTGWLGRLLGPLPHDAGNIADALILGESRPGPLEAPGMDTLYLDHLDSFLREADSLKGSAPEAGTDPALLVVRARILHSAALLEALKPALRPAAAAFPASTLGSQLELVSRLLAAGARIPVVKLTLRGFDTHVEERATHDRFLAELSSAVAAFRSSLMAAGLWDRVTVATYSEFGRRLAENGSGGTDHGTAAPLFVWGGLVKGGLYGSQPSLGDLDAGDLRMTMDFREALRSLALFLVPPGCPSLAAALPGGTRDLGLFRSP